MTLQEIQNVSLNILKDVHAFCESHDIKYSLAYGTLIGAIRHKGFVPWDDDVDIVIPRPDFERFCQNYRSSKGYVLYPADATDNFMPFARVCDDEHTMVVTNHPWNTKNTGIWIDIFPLDGLPADETEFIKFVKDVREIQEKIYRIRTGRFLNLSNTISVKDYLFCLIKRVMYLRYDIRELLRQNIQLIQRYGYDESNYCGQLCVMDYPEKEHNPKADFEYYIKKPFCDMDFNVMNGYDNILRHYYGNYMELPPVEKRVPPESFKQKYYWRK